MWATNNDCQRALDSIVFTFKNRVMPKYLRNCEDENLAKLQELVDRIERAYVPDNFTTDIYGQSYGNCKCGHRVSDVFKRCERCGQLLVWGRK